MKEVWVLEFTGDCCDCNGVYSTKEKAKAALLSHYTRCSDIWENFVCVDNEHDNYELYEFEIGEDLFSASISLYEIDKV